MSGSRSWRRGSGGTGKPCCWRELPLLARRRWRSRKASWQFLVVKVEGGVPEALTVAVKEVSAEIPFELLPKSDGARELAIDQEDGKKASERVRHHVADGVCKVLDPFLAVLREATGDAGLTKSRVDDPLVSAEVLEARGARHGDEEETEEEAITSGWMDGVHTAHGF